MKKLALFALAATALGTGFVSPADAAPPPGGPVGRKCGMNSGTDVTREAGWQVGAINAGPLVTGEAGTLYCEIHVNNNSHGGPWVVRESAAAVGVAVVMEPRPMSYPATAADTVSLCTRWEGSTTGTWYWRSGDARKGDLGSWERTAGECGESLSIEPNDPTCSIWHSIDNRAGTNIAEIWQDCDGYPPII